MLAGVAVLELCSEFDIYKDTGKYHGHKSADVHGMSRRWPHCLCRHIETTSGNCWREFLAPDGHHKMSERQLLANWSMSEYHKCRPSSAVEAYVYFISYFINYISILVSQFQMSYAVCTAKCIHLHLCIAATNLTWLIYFKFNYRIGNGMKSLPHRYV